MNRAWLPLTCLFLALAFSALGVWQLERRAWKLDLIDRVNARVQAKADPLPPRAAWAGVNAQADEYRRIRVNGELLHDRETRVQAVTDLGAGYWVMTPLRTGEGIVLINRGFVPPAGPDSVTRHASAHRGEVTVTGLLRMTEPHGGFLRANDPAEGRWYSRDVVAIARARGLADVAPFFIDAEASPVPDNSPVGGLTVVRFRNAHLTYALTWFALAGLSLFGLIVSLRSPRGS